MRSTSFLAAVLALGLFACGGDDDGTPEPTGDVDVISATDCASLSPKLVIGNTGSTSFTPNAASIKVGDVIKFLPAGGHDMQSDDNTTFDTGNLGTSACLRFNVKGDYPFHCSAHPGMTGKITVTE